MYNNYDYPIGADTPSAPWNKPQEEKFTANVTYTIEKTVSIPSKNCLLDEDGHTVMNNPYDEYLNNCTGIEDVLGFAAQAAMKLLEQHDYSLGDKYKLTDIINASDNWEVSKPSIVQI